FDDVELWEPGAVVYETLEVVNEGTLALKYQLSVNVANATANANGDTLADVLKVGVIDGGATITDRDALIGEVKDWSSLASFTKYGKLDLSDDNNKSDTYTVVIYWEPSENDNDYNMNNDNKVDALTVEIGVNLYATQLESESDSFNNTYDEDAWMDGMIVFSEADLNAALANGSNITLGADIALSSAVTISEDATVNLDLGGKTLSSASGNAIVNNGALTVTNGTVSAVSAYAISNNGSLTVDVATIESGVYNSGYMKVNSGKVYTTRGGSSHAIYHAGTMIVVEGGEFSGNGNEIIYATNSASIVINGGTFDKVEKSSYLVRGTRMRINGGTFYAYDENGADPVEHYAQAVSGIYGGTFNYDPTSTNQLANGYTAVENNDGTYTVLPEVEGAELTCVTNGLYTDGTNYYINNAAGLKATNDILTSTDGRYSKGFNRSYILMDDIDASGITWKTAWMEGNSATDVALTLDGQGHTISNLTTTGALLSGNSNGAVIKNITFDNVTVESSGYHVAVIWGEAYGSMSLQKVKIMNSSVTGKCNVAALVGSTAQDVSVTYIACKVTNTTITSTGTHSGVVGDWSCDPTGANVFMGRALGGTTLKFSVCSSEDNTVTNKNGLVGGGIYGYTAISDGWWTDTGSCDTFTNWDGITVG
ncbi:MAG: hypothetical protein IJ011_03975, partial [Clostridia bacterium]|nr:hypothetical protein [Clostridia bacterium]